MQKITNHYIRNTIISLLPWIIFLSVSATEHYTGGHGEWVPPIWYFVGMGVVLLNLLFNLLYWAITISPPHNRYRFAWFLALNHIPIIILVYVLFIAK